IFGLDAAGNADISGGDGISVNAVAAGAGTLIGGTDAQARNVISGHAIGIHLSTSGSPANVTVQGNYVGTDITGTVARGNSVGVNLGSSPGTVVGGTAAGAGNLISGNSTGLQIDGLSHPVIGGSYNSVV